MTCHPRFFRARGPQWMAGFGSWLGLLCLLLALGLAPAVQAQATIGPHDQLHRLIQAGQLEQALEEAERQRTQRPNDPQVRFMLGLIQTQLGLNEAALATYTALTQDFPELPEPHNNLAVLHASAGRLEHARAALETALRLHPEYATAHQNLGDVYLQLAAQAYRTSLQLRPTSPALAQRLQQLQALQAPR